MTPLPIKSIRRASVPIVGIETPDPAATILAVTKALNGKSDATPLLAWDIIRALHALNPAGQTALSQISDDPAVQTSNPAECLRLLAKAPPETIIFWHNAHRYLDNEAVAQGIWNLRDVFKGEQHCTLFLLAPALTLPSELKNDAVLLSEALPTEGELLAILDGISKDAGLDSSLMANKKPILDSLLGLPAFAAEQTLALSVTKDGIDQRALWDRKCKAIEQTPGLSVWKGGETFDDIGGCANIKAFLAALLKGNAPPRAIAFIDEIEKSMAGAQSDTSGVSQDYLRNLLTYMQDREASGLIFVGPPGAAKSAIAKAAGNHGGIPTIALDLGGMKGSLVGESERRLREALKVVDAVSQGAVLFVATCNSLGVLPPELKRRFTLGTFFFDLPTSAERKGIWDIYQKKYSLEKHLRPPDEGWTGAEIKQCCQIAWRLNRNLQEAAAFIVPVARSAADQIDNLRRQASGKFISASQPGPYTCNPVATASQQPVGRKIERS